MIDLFKILGKKNYDISVVMPIYNAESFLCDAIDSILEQSIGFERIQLILVNDGSNDRSAEICKKYRKAFPKNIFYVSQRNKGVSAARNRGLRLVRGKYIVFFDSDDIWERSSFKHMYDYFEEHFDEIDCLSARVKIFGDKEYEHSMNFKYNGDEIIDINDHPDYLVTLAGNMMFKSSVIKDLRFDESVSMGEDTLFDTYILKNKEKYGQVDNALLMYRKHDQGALTSDRYHNKTWYLDYPKDVLKRIASMSIEECGEVKQYVQELIAYWIRYAAVDNGIHEVLSEEELRSFDSIFKELLQYLDDHTIAALKKTPLLTRNHILEMKHSIDLYSKAKMDKNGKLRFNREVIFNPSGSGLVKIEKCERVDDTVVVEGTTMICRAEGHCDLFAYSTEYPNELIPVIPNGLDYIKYMYNRMIANKREKFKVIIPISSTGCICFITKYPDSSQVFLPGVINQDYLNY